MLPALYEEGEDDRYAGAVYVRGSSDGGAVLYTAKYGLGDGPGVIYGGEGYGGGDRYGADARLYGAGSDGYGGRYGSTPTVGEYGPADVYGAVLDAVDPFDYLDGNSSYGAADVGLVSGVPYAAPARSVYVLDELDVELPREWSPGAGWEYN